MRNKVIGLDGREYTWSLIGHTINNNDIRPRSSYHLRCRKLLQDLYPTSPICEEIKLPGTRNLSLDFYLPHQRVAIEVQGEQHYKIVGKFHKDKRSFLAGIKRDADKQRWCKINNIRLVTLRYDDGDPQWTTQITDLF